MDRWSRHIVWIGCLLALGCRNRGNQELLERELRWQDEEITMLQDEVDRYKRELEKRCRENERTKSTSTYDEEPGPRRSRPSRDRSSAPPRETEMHDTAPPEVELPEAERAPPFEGPPAIRPPDPNVPDGVLPESPAPQTPAPSAAAAPARLRRPVAKSTAPTAKLSGVKAPRRQATDETDSLVPPDLESTPGELAPPTEEPPSLTPPEEPTPSPPQSRRAVPGEVRSILVSSETKPQPATIALNSTLTVRRKTGEDPSDRLVVVLEPRDSMGRLVDPAGALAIAVLDPSKDGDAARLARWDFASKDVSENLRASQEEGGVRLELDWPATPPTTDKLLLYVRLTTVDGKKLMAEQELGPPLAEGQSSAWTAKGGVRLVSGAEPAAASAWRKASKPLNRPDDVEANAVAPGASETDTAGWTAQSSGRGEESTTLPAAGDPGDDAHRPGLLPDSTEREAKPIRTSTRERIPWESYR